MKQTVVHLLPQAIVNLCLIVLICETACCAPESREAVVKFPKVDCCVKHAVVRL